MVTVDVVKIPDAETNEEQDDAFSSSATCAHDYTYWGRTGKRHQPHLLHDGICPVRTAFLQGGSEDGLHDVHLAENNSARKQSIGRLVELGYFGDVVDGLFRISWPSWRSCTTSSLTVIRMARATRAEPIRMEERRDVE